MSEQELREQLQAAQAEAAAMVDALKRYRTYDDHVEECPYCPKEPCALGLHLLPTGWARAALSGDAGAAYQREHAAMREALEYVRDNAENMLTARRISAMTLDALSAPAAEPEVNDA